MKTRVKICCIASEEEARMAISFGAAALGLVAAMPSGPGPIADELCSGVRTDGKLDPKKLAAFFNALSY